MRYLFALAVLLWSPTLSAQVNLESERHTVGGKEGFHLNSELSLGFQRGNIKVFQYQLSLRADYIQKAHHAYLVGSTGYGEENEKAFQNQRFGHARYTWMCFTRLGVEAFSQIESDEFKLLNLRQLNGGGVRVVLSETKSLLLAMGVGGMSDYERVSGGDNFVGRGTSYLSLSSEGSKMKSVLVGYYQPSFSDLSDYRILAQGSLEFPLVEKLSWVNLLSYAYDTAPPEGVVKEDLSLTIKLKYKWR